MDELVARSSDGDIEFALNWLARDSKKTAAEATSAHARKLCGCCGWLGRSI